MWTMDIYFLLSFRERLLFIWNSYATEKIVMLCRIISFLLAQVWNPDFHFNPMLDHATWRHLLYLWLVIVSKSTFFVSKSNSGSLHHRIQAAGCMQLESTDDGVWWNSSLHARLVAPEPTGKWTCSAFSTEVQLHSFFRTVELTIFPYSYRQKTITRS
jgi:hypothetical protein